MTQTDSVTDGGQDGLKMKSIVVGYDGSEHANRGLERAASLVDQNGQVVVVSATPLVIDPRPGLAGPRLNEVEGEKATERDDVLREAKDWLEQRGVKTVPVEVYGDPPSAIIEEARRHSADLIVVGKRGHIFGSATTKIVEHAPCDVLVTV